MKIVDELQHFEFNETDELPFRIFENLGSGNEAQIQVVRVEGRYVGFPFRCVRRSWRATHRELKRRSKDFEQEVNNLVKLRGERHVIRILGSYQQGRQFGILHLPRAQCNLDELLNMSELERQAQIADTDLVKGLGCLSAALYTVHDANVRHKDIKPRNILVDRNNLLLCDFGISIDFSESDDSQTSGPIRGTANYYAPEIKEDRPRGCSADVFALGCVFLEILSVISGIHTTDEESFAFCKPYRQNLERAQAWVEKWKAHHSNDNLIREFWFIASRLMVAHDSSYRPRMSNVILQLRHQMNKHIEGFSDSACDTCMEIKVSNIEDAKLDELRNANFVWEMKGVPNLGRLLAFDIDLSERLPNSNDGASYGLLRYVAAPIMAWIQRWTLKVYLDKGTVLRAYGTLPGAVNYTYDFGNVLIDRIEFEPGTLANEVELYRNFNWEKGGSGPCFRKAGKFNERLNEPLRIRSYRVFRS